jgi:hypothetical protein
MVTRRTSKHSKLNRCGIGLLVLLVIAGVVSATLILKPGKTAATTPKKAPVGAAVPSQFTFSGATGWWQGATSKSDIAIFPNAMNCFVSVQHITGSLTAKQARDQASVASLTSQGHTVTQLGSQSLSIKTNTGVKQYQLQQINVSNPSGASTSNGGQLEGGQESAYIPLSNSDFLYVEGYCDTSSELPTTIPVLQAISFDANKVK